MSNLFELFPNMAEETFLCCFALKHSSRLGQFAHMSPLHFHPDCHRQSNFTLVIDEPLPSKKELTAAVEEHWTSMIHNAIAMESQSGIPEFQKAFVMIEITTPRGNNNRQVWDTSNRAINVIINNLKGIFFKDDDFEHMASASLPNGKKYKNGH